MNAKALRRLLLRYERWSYLPILTQTSSLAIKEPVVILGPKRYAEVLKAQWHHSGNLCLPNVESANERLVFVCVLGVGLQPEEVKTG